MFDFEFAVIGVRKCQCPPIAKNGHCLVERYTVFQQIACRLLIIPFKLEHAKYLKGLTFDMSGRRRLAGGWPLDGRVRFQHTAPAPSLPDALAIAKNCS
jgi:hypothetical protein